MASQAAQKDWSANQYLKFGNERTRPVYDLVSQIAPHIRVENPRIYDLGCGPGNSTKVLLDAFSSANVTGMDSSPDMLAKASASLPNVEFVKGDLGTFALKEGNEVDVLFSNAVFHWLRSDVRIDTLTRLFKSLRSGAVVAIQVPDNYNERSHALMRETATTPESAWSKSFADAQVGNLENKKRPDLDPIEPASVFYNALSPHASTVNIWRTEYQHVLKDANAIVEWVKGTGLQPYLQMIEDEEAKKAFLDEYEKRLVRAYPALADGHVLLAYPRLFVVAVRK